MSKPKPSQLYTKEEAQANAERWMRYTHDFIIRFIRDPLTKIADWFLSWNIFNEGFETFLTTLIWIATTVVLIIFHLKIYR